MVVVLSWLNKPYWQSDFVLFGTMFYFVCSIIKSALNFDSLLPYIYRIAKMSSPLLYLSCLVIQGNADWLLWVDSQRWDRKEADFFLT